MGLPEEIAGRLVAQGIGTVAWSVGEIYYPVTAAGWLITALDFHPSTVNDQQIAVIPTGGYAPEVSEGTTHLTKPTFQTLVRGPNPNSTLYSSGVTDKVADVITALNLYQGTLEGHKYLDIQLTGEPSFIGRDANQRPVFSVNWLAMRSRTT